jgi:hypothetical protein
VAGQAAVEFTVVQQLFRRHRAVQHAQQILSRDAVARLVVENRARWARRSAMKARMMVSSGTVS